MVASHQESPKEGLLDLASSSPYSFILDLTSFFPISAWETGVFSRFAVPIFVRWVGFRAPMCGVLDRRDNLGPREVPKAIAFENVLTSTC